MSVFQRLQSTEISTRTASISIGVLLAVAAAVIVMVRGMVAGPPSGIEVARSPSAPPSSRDAAVTPDRIEEKPGPAQSKPADTESDRLDFVFKRDIFKPIAGAGQKPAAAPSVQIPPMPVGGFGQMPGGFPRMPAFAGGFGRGAGDSSAGKIAFTGVVETPDGVQAMLENTATSESAFVGVGEEAFGMQVAEINRRQVTLYAGGQEVRLSIGQNKTDGPQGTPGGPPPGAQPPATGAPPGTQPPGTPGVMPQIPGFDPAAFRNFMQGGPPGGWGGGRGRGRRGPSGGGQPQP